MNDALAKEVDRNVRGRGETESTAGELAAPQESKDVPIPPDSNPRKRRAMKAVTAVARSGKLADGKQPCSGRGAKNGRRGRREIRIQKFKSTEHQETNNHKGIKGRVKANPGVRQNPNTRRRIVTKTSLEESQMDDQGKEREESRSATEPEH